MWYPINWSSSNSVCVLFEFLSKLVSFEMSQVFNTVHDWVVNFLICSVLLDFIFSRKLYINSFIKEIFFSFDVSDNFSTNSKNERLELAINFIVIGI
jgi:hypothetical protein